MQVGVVDPGVTSGFVLVRYVNDSGDLSVLKQGEVDCRLLGLEFQEDPWGACQAAGASLGMFLRRCNVVIMEDFRLRSQIGTTDVSGISPVMVGMATLCSLRWQRGYAGEVVWQMAGFAKGSFDDERLAKRLSGLEGVSGRMSRHVKDCYRHLFTWQKQAAFRLVWAEREAARRRGRDRTAEAWAEWEDGKREKW